MKQATIKLAGQTYTIDELTLGEVEDLTEVVEQSNVALPGQKRGRFDGPISIILQALKKTHPEVNATTLRASFATLRELRLAQSEILKLAGLVPGEEDAGAASA